MDTQFTWGDIGALWTHRSYVKNARRISDTLSLKLGDVVALIYAKTPRFVMVVHGNWHGKMHCLDLKLIDRNALLQSIIPTLDSISDPEVFYHSVYKRDALYSLDAYRTYNLDKIGDLMHFDYDIPNVSSEDVKQQFNDDDVTPPPNKN